MQGEGEQRQPGRGPGRDLAEHGVRLAAAALGAQPEQSGDGPGDGLPGGRIRDDRARGAAGRPVPPAAPPASVAFATSSAPVAFRLRTAESGAARGGCAGVFGFDRPGQRRRAYSAAPSSSPSSPANRAPRGFLRRGAAVGAGSSGA
ncbi:hypothetical protein GCM10010231_62940 [Streptomyces sindenensis]|nr:hypothetical protein GCM10010231_62940 [Streptomyces sindenensis]